MAGLDPSALLGAERETPLVSISDVVAWPHHHHTNHTVAALLVGGGSAAFKLKFICINSLLGWWSMSTPHGPLHSKPPISTGGKNAPRLWLCTVAISSNTFAARRCISERCFIVLLMLF